MHFVTNDFIDRFRVSGVPTTDAMVEVTVPLGAPYLDLEVLTSLHVTVPESTLERSADEQIAELRADLVDEVRRRRQRFDRPADRSGSDEVPGYRAPHLLISCGDMIAARTSSETDLDRARIAYQEVCLPALKELVKCENGRQSGQLLAIPGNEDVYRGGGDVRGTWGAKSEKRDDYPYFTYMAKPLAHGALPDRPEEHPVATIFRVSEERPPGPETTKDVPLACVAVIGFDSNAVQYMHDLAENMGQIDREQLERAEQLIHALRSSIGRTTPLYVLGVTHHNLLLGANRMIRPPAAADRAQYVKRIAPESGGCPEPLKLCLTNQVLVNAAMDGTSNATAFLQKMQDLRASVLVHGSMHHRQVTTLTSTPLVVGEPPRGVTVFGAPDHRPNLPTSGLARIRLDLWRGETELAVAFDTSGAEESETRPVMSRPLTSASRINAGERRLYTKVSQLIDKALAENSEAGEQLKDFIHHVNGVWEADGYAAVSLKDGSLPEALGPAERQSRYYLLLLLREGDGRYEILLNRHSPTRPSEVAEWDTLLMPAFTSVRDLMSRLRSDVDRQMRQAQELDQSARAQSFDVAVEEILRGKGGNVQDDIWQEHLRDVGTTERRKVSPTTGQITNYEYHLVVLIPFVRADRNSLGHSTPDSPHEDAIRAYLRDLPNVQQPNAQLANWRHLPMEAIQTDGSGLRWDPGSSGGQNIDDAYEGEYVDEGLDDLEERGRSYPPGSVWFPLPHLGDRESHWRKVPSIIARNADVMTWVDAQLGIGQDVTAESRRDQHGRFQPWLVMGQMKEIAGYRRYDEPRPFERPESKDPEYSEPEVGDAGDPVPAPSTREAIFRVQYNDKLPLRGQFPYRGLVVTRLVLARDEVTTHGGSRRDAICVYQAPSGCTRAELSDLVRAQRPIGVLRPAQRYVLKAGIKRAHDVNAFLERESTDPWGFARVDYDGAGKPVSLTPPIIEQVSAQDVDGSYEGTEFLVCDGNHRIVEKVWRGEGGGMLAAVGVLGEPPFPYYARPFSPYEWDVTSDNELTITPPKSFKYAPRQVTERALAAELGGREDAFRVYYRDFNKGFGFVGGQGGRYV